MTPIIWKGHSWICFWEILCLRFFIFTKNSLKIEQAERKAPVSGRIRLAATAAQLDATCETMTCRVKLGSRTHVRVSSRWCFLAAVWPHGYCGVENPLIDERCPYRESILKAKWQGYSENYPHFRPTWDLSSSRGQLDIRSRKLIRT